MLACRIHAKPAVFRSGVLNPFCPLAEESVFIPKIDQQAEKQPCASDWSADKVLCLARHRGLHAYADVARLTSFVQAIDANWVFALKSKLEQLPA
jgi:hypothetical protein